MPPTRSSARLALGVSCTLCALIVPTLAGQRYRLTEDGTLAMVDVESGPVIRGHVVDPHQLRPEEAVLMLGRENDGGFASVPIPVAADGSFVTHPLSPDTYVLEILRTPHSATKAATVVGFTIIAVGTSDVSDVTVEVRPDTAIRGRFRMESDNPHAKWPTYIAVSAVLALDGMPFLTSTTAEGAPAGEFVLRNAFGPRVLRSGDASAPDSLWWQSRVLLDGMDITNVPTDFSEHENGQLEVVFTQHPARIEGTVTDAQGQPARAWVAVVPVDRALWQHWATTSTVGQAGPNGTFSIPILPGEYRVDTIPQRAFSSWSAAHSAVASPVQAERMFGFRPPEVTVRLAEREVKMVSLTLRKR